jgi:hypothetical protein
MTELLRDKGTPLDSIMTEAFSQGPNRQTGKIRSWPINIYVLGALGMVMASFAILLIDVFKSIPTSTLSLSSNNAKNIAERNKRQQELDNLVNAMPPLNNPAPATAATIPKTITETVTSSGTVVAPGSSSTPTTTTTSAPVPAPAPVRTPVCTTTASGVTTCI